VAPPADACAVGDGSLNCAGYGSSVTVTATFGMVAAAEAVAKILSRPLPQTEISCL
jgi:tRNA A37 threonylcarbamoyladenosine dehydratase